MEFRTKLHTQESSKDRTNSKSKLMGFDVELKRQYGSDLKEMTRTPNKDEQGGEYRLKLENSRKDLNRQTIQPKFHSDRKKDIQKKIRQLV